MTLETYGYRVWTERDRTTTAEWVFGGPGPDRIAVRYNSYNGGFMLSFGPSRYRFDRAKELPEHIKRIVVRDMGEWSRFGPTEIGLCTRPVEVEE